MVGPHQPFGCQPPFNPLIKQSLPYLRLNPPKWINRRGKGEGANDRLGCSHVPFVQEVHRPFLHWTHALLRNFITTHYRTMNSKIMSMIDDREGKAASIP